MMIPRGPVLLHVTGETAKKLDKELQKAKAPDSKKIRDEARKEIYAWMKSEGVYDIEDSNND